MHKIILSVTLLFTMLASTAKVPEGFNEDESKVQPYTLPNVLQSPGGSTCQTEAAWKGIRRGEVMAMLETEMFGKAPALPASSSIVAKETGPPAPAFDGRAIRQQITLTWSDKADVAMDLLIYLPRNANGPVPLFWGFNFEGNHSVEDDPSIPISRSILAMEAKGNQRTNKKSASENRGGSKGRFPLEIALDAGYAVATCCYHDVDPDFDDGFKNGVHQLFSDQRDDASWGSIAAWSYGMRVGLEYFLTRKDIEPNKIIAMGHSRLGKAALWAGALEERFALVISNNSGCGGAALSKRNFGETVSRINNSFPHWFCKNFRKYNDNEAALPWDQHFLIAAMAPRPVLITSATEDAWADPKGEFLSGLHAGPVYQLYGKKGLPSGEMPAPDTLVGQHVGYNLRTGQHNVTAADWKSYVAFANQHLKKAP